MDIPQLRLPVNSLPVTRFSEHDREKVVILPIGHTEQHGYHAPLSTDTLIIEAIGQGTARAVPEQALCLPVFPYGVSTHRRSFPGTFNVGGRAFEDFWLAVVDALVAARLHPFLPDQRARRELLVPGQCGQVRRGEVPADFLRHLLPVPFRAAGSGRPGSQDASPALGGMGHACELETSLVLHLRPELVHLERAVDETDFITTPSYYMDWIEGGALVANPPWEDDTRTGAYGAGSLGTAEKGKYWLEAAIAEKVGHVAEIHEQYRRRQERRNMG